MKVWFTRPHVATCFSRGITECVVWMKKPFFDVTPRGPEAGRLYAHLPVGWRVLDEDSLDACGPLSCEVGRLLESHPDVQSAVWHAVAQSIDGKAPGNDWRNRWFDLAFKGDDFDSAGPDTFLHECEIPPDLWFRIAVHNGWENETFPSRRYREQLWMDAQNADDPLPF
jgi:hypothetical protein